MKRMLLVLAGLFHVGLGVYLTWTHQRETEPRLPYSRLNAGEDYHASLRANGETAYWVMGKRGGRFTDILWQDGTREVLPDRVGMTLVDVDPAPAFVPTELELPRPYLIWRLADGRAVARSCSDGRVLWEGSWADASDSNGGT